MRTLFPLLLLAGCTQDYGYVESRHTDVFQQKIQKAVDLLVVIDNSGSMVEEQDNLARNFDALIGAFGDADVSWQVAVTTTDVEGELRGLLVGGDDEIIVRGPRGELDRVEYDRSWGFTPGVALQLDDVAGATFATNDQRSAWCDATDAFGSDGALGTPGAPNPRCDGTAFTPSPGEDSGLREPSTGDLIISEIFATSAGVDSECEWLELASRADDTLDLSGVELSDRGRDLAVFPDGTHLEPWGSLVVGRTADACGAGADVVVGDTFILHDDVRVITTETADARDRFAENVSQGTDGSGIEMGLEGARLVFEEPTWTESNADTGFLRDEAILAVLFVTDEDDLSPYPVDAYLRYLQGLKGDEGFREEGRVVLSAVVGKDLPPRDDLPACESDAGVAWYGRRYIDAANATGGLIESICEEDFAPVVERLGLTLTGLEARFELAEYPQLDTLEVSLYASADDDSKVADLVRDVDYTYVSDDNALHFGEGQVPAAGMLIVANYELLAAGAQGGE